MAGQWGDGPCSMGAFRRAGPLRHRHRPRCHTPLSTTRVPTPAAHPRVRAATLLSILAFTLLVSAQGDEAWISGGFTITLNATRVAAPLPPAVSALCAECVAVKAAQPPPLGATFQRRFNVGLHAMSVEGSRHYDATNVDSYQTCAYDLKDWINEYNSGVWSSKPISWTTVQSTQGLLIFGAILLVRRAASCGVPRGGRAVVWGGVRTDRLDTAFVAFSLPLWCPAGLHVAGPVRGAAGGARRGQLEVVAARLPRRLAGVRVFHPGGRQ